MSRSHVFGENLRTKAEARADAPNVRALASIWVGLARIATFLAIWLKISTALLETVVGTVAQLIIGAVVEPAGLAAKTEWITFLAGTGASVLTFLAGAELDSVIFRAKWKETTAAGLVGFSRPFLGRTPVAQYVLRWTAMSSWLAGVALSTTSVAVVDAVVLEMGLKKTEFGKVILAACFANDLGTVIALGLIYSPFTIRTVIFVFFGSSIAVEEKSAVNRGRPSATSECGPPGLLPMGRGYRVGWRRPRP